jgi:XapX domain-containing protein
MKEILLSLSVGLVFGLICISLKLPLPAPKVFAGVAGIMGIWMAQPVWAAISKFMS